MNPEHDRHDPHGHERRLAEALGALVQQIDISDYRDSKGHPAKNNIAFLHAQGIVDEFGVTHDDICAVLGTCGDDAGEAARQLSQRMRREPEDAPEASPRDKPPEYRTWQTGP